MPALVQTTIRRSQRVEIALVEEDYRWQYEGERIGARGGTSYHVRSNWRALDPDKVKTLRKLLLNPRSWQTVQKPCEFSPNVAFRWSDGADTACALLCHGCDTMLGWEGASRFGAEVDPIGPRLLELSFGVFPTDSLLQAIAARKQLRY